MRTVVILLLGLFTISLSAQEDPLMGDGTLLTFGIGIPINTVRDKAHSPLAYRGGGLRVFFTWEEFGENGMSRLDLTIDDIDLKAYVKPRQDYKRETSLSDVRLSVGYYVDVNSTEDVRQYVGGVYSVQFNNRDYPLPANNISGYVLQTSLGVGAYDRRSLETGEWGMSSRFELPLLTAITRPAFIGMPEVPYKVKYKAKDILKTLQFVTVNKFFNPHLGIDFDQQARPWRTNRYGYDWNLFYTGLPAGKPVLSTTSAFTYGYRVLQ